jgi:hypothetical protein
LVFPCPGRSTRAGAERKNPARTLRALRFDQEFCYGSTQLYHGSAWMRYASTWMRYRSTYFHHRSTWSGCPVKPGHRPNSFSVSVVTATRPERTLFWFWTLQSTARPLDLAYPGYAERPCAGLSSGTFPWFLRPERPHSVSPGQGPGVLGSARYRGPVGAIPFALRSSCTGTRPYYLRGISTPG